jgi:hypothetical protein
MRGPWHFGDRGIGLDVFSGEVAGRDRALAVRVRLEAEETQSTGVHVGHEEERFALNAAEEDAAVAGAQAGIVRILEPVRRIAAIGRLLARGLAVVHHEMFVFRVDLHAIARGIDVRRIDERQPLQTPDSFHVFVVALQNRPAACDRTAGADVDIPGAIGADAHRIVETQRAVPADLAALARKNAAVHADRFGQKRRHIVGVVEIDLLRYTPIRHE